MSVDPGSPRWRWCAGAVGERMWGTDIGTVALGDVAIVVVAP